MQYPYKRCLLQCIGDSCALTPFKTPNQRSVLFCHIVGFYFIFRICLLNITDPIKARRRGCLVSMPKCNVMTIFQRSSRFLWTVKHGEKFWKWNWPGDVNTSSGYILYQFESLVLVECRAKALLLSRLDTLVLVLYIVIFVPCITLVVILYF